jgi:hypothetical protein
VRKHRDADVVKLLLERPRSGSLFCASAAEASSTLANTAASPKSRVITVDVI